MGIAKEIFGIELTPLTSPHARNISGYASGYIHGQHDVCSLVDDFEISEEAIASAIYESLKGIMKSESTGQEWTLWLHKNEVESIAKAIKANAKKIFVRRGK